jgi:membrane carboxypeptidase/penicillin-binding protein
LSLYDDQELYRGGLTIHTTLDKTLQEELNHMVDDSQDAKREEGEMITAVKQGGVIRAITCDVSHESEILSHLENPIFPFSGYEVSVLSVKSLPREQIILPSAAGMPGLYQ